MDDRSRRRELRDSLWLSGVPIGVALLLGVLLAPRRAAPEAVPLPVADRAALARVAADDARLAEAARGQPLPGSVRALGSAIRAFHKLEARAESGGDPSADRELGQARRAVDDALIEALQGGVQPLVELRAAQLEGFLEQVRVFRATGTQSPELQALAGGFVRSMTNEGWCTGHTLAPGDATLRAMFKQMWTAFLGLENRRELALALDEQRALYAFYLSHAHPSRTMRDALTAARRGARDAAACEAIARSERSATESWRLERIARIGAIDPSYPAAYARGIASFRRGDYGAAAQAFRIWLRDHPEGPLALRAQTFLRAAMDADRIE